MKKILITLIFAALLIGHTAQAAASVHHATVLPGGFLYNFKILGEFIWQKVASVGGSEAEMNYLVKRINNRAEETLTLIDNGSVNSATYIETINKSNELKSNFVVLLAKVAESKRLKMAELENSFYESDVRNDYAGLMLQKMDEARQQILAAQKTGDTAKAFELVNNLKNLKQVYTDSKVTFDLAPLLEKQSIDQTENLLAGTDKITYALDWANKYKQMISDTSKNDLYKSSQDLFAKASQINDNLISDLKKIPLDNVDNKKLDDLFAGTRNLLNDTARAIYQKSLNENLANQLPEETTQPTQPQTEQQTQQATTQNQTPTPSKPKLKIIPSESVQRSPLLLHYFKTLDGEVGTDVNVQYSAEGGLAPYHFQLGSGVGFPPHKVVLDTNGLLSGTPDIDGTSKFNVCVVDTAGRSVCADTVMTVSPAPTPTPVETPPPPPEIPAHITLDSRSCFGSSRTPDGGLEISGTATGPIGSHIGWTGQGWELSRACGSWNACKRGSGDPEQTTWVIRTSANYPGTNGKVSVTGVGRFYDPVDSVVFDNYCP